MNFTKSSKIYNTATIKSTNDENKHTNVKSLIEIFFGHKIAQNYELFRDQQTSDVKPFQYTWSAFYVKLLSVVTVWIETMYFW